MSKNKTILYTYRANILTTILFFELICFDFYIIFIFIFDNFLCFDFEIKYSIEFINDIRTKFFLTLIKSTIKINVSIFATTTTTTTSKQKNCFFFIKIDILVDKNDIRNDCNDNRNKNTNKNEKYVKIDKYNEKAISIK